MKVRRSLGRAVLAGSVLAALAAPSAMADPQIVANAFPGAPSLSPSGNMASTRIDCSATDPTAASVEVHCWTTNGADVSASGFPTAYGSDTAFTGPIGVAFTSFTFCAEATSHFDDAPDVTRSGCVVDDLGWATIL